MFWPTACCSRGSGVRGRLGKGWLLRDVVNRLRRPLGDDAANPRYIVTEPRVGYWMAAGEEASDADEGG